MMEEYINLCTGMLPLKKPTFTTFYHSFHVFKLFLKGPFCFCFVSDLARNIMHGVALALGGTPYEFEGNRAGDAFWVMRIIGYPGKPSENGQEKPVNDIGW